MNTLYGFTDGQISLKYTAKINVEGYLLRYKRLPLASLKATFDIKT